MWTIERVIAELNKLAETGWHSLDESYDPYTPILAWMPLPKSYKEESEDKV